MNDTRSEASLIEHVPHNDFGRKLVLGVTLGLTVVLCVAMLFVDAWAAWLMFGLVVLDVLLVGAVRPRRYQILGDRVRVVMGEPFAFDIPLSSVLGVRAVSGWRDVVRRSHRFDTSKSNMLEIVRRQGWNVIVSPSNPDTFMEDLNQALDSRRNPALA